MGNKMRREVNINIPHRHHLAGILEATLYLYIGKRSIPREINLASHERLNQGIVVRVEHPVELDAMPKKMRLESSEYTDVSRRRRSTEPHHNDLLLLLHTADPAHGRIKHLPTRTGWTGPSVCQFYSDSCAARPALEQRSQILDEPSGDRVSASFTAAEDSSNPSPSSEESANHSFLLRRKACSFAGSSEPQQRNGKG